ncbi:hypothetical protein ACH5RR_004037 [Cinchona calisaya]|uniref:DDE Tnp4 domain-containing protein n=1 Tax=Cinchona calisaya TaxID=153742 RepID=A0ABD3AWK5_9GENT
MDNHLHVLSGVQNSAAGVVLDLSLQLGLPTPQFPQLNSLDLNGHGWALQTDGLQQVDQLRQLPANSESSVNQPRHLELSSTTSSDVSQFRKLLGKVTYHFQSTPENQSFSSPMRGMKEDYNATVLESERPRRGSPETEGIEPGGSSQRILRENILSKASWEHFRIQDFPEEEFKKAFRMSKATFDMICDELEPFVAKRFTILHLAIPVRQQVAVCIWRLATGEPLREVSMRFGLLISTCHEIVLDVCSAIRDVLLPKFVAWPSEEKMREVKRGFEIISMIDDVVGSIYTTHVPIMAPKISPAAYLHTERNHKTSHSITVQGVVDHKGVFTDMCIGWPGSMTDDEVLEKSALYQRANRGLLKDAWIVGNAGFPLVDWVLVPYTKQNITWNQHTLNEKIGEVQSVSKEAFMRLKVRWRFLQERSEVELQDLPVVIGACGVLHNICEMRDEVMSPELRFELFDDEVVPENPVRSINALKARDQIASKLL